MQTMWAVRKLAAEPGLVVDQVPVPSAGDDEVLVRVEAASICGTDLHIYELGRVVAAADPPAADARPRVRRHGRRGRRATCGHVEVGDYVSAESHVTCGMCFQCRTGHAHMCERTRILGVDRDGAFAEYVAVPESVIWQNDRTKLPPEIATLQEPFGNAVFATERAGSAGRSVAVLGCGPIGLFTIAHRPRRPAPPASARPTARRSGSALATTMGAHATVNVDETPDDGRAGSASRTRATASTSSSRCRARRARSPTRSRSRATAAAWCCSGSRRGRSRSTSPRR